MNLYTFITQWVGPVGALASLVISVLVYIRQGRKDQVEIDTKLSDSAVGLAAEIRAQLAEERKRVEFLETQVSELENKRVDDTARIKMLESCLGTLINQLERLGIKPECDALYTS